MCGFRDIKGFTLIELLIVLVVVGILTAIAIPSYQRYVERGNASAAQQFMLDIASRQEQFLLDTRAYAADLTALSMAIPTSVVDNYNFPAFDAGTAPPRYTIRAVPKGSMTGTSAMTLESNGTRAGCWSGWAQVDVHGVAC